MRGLFNKNLFNNILFNTALIIAIAGLFNPAQFQTQPYNTGLAVPVIPPPPPHHPLHYHGTCISGSGHSHQAENRRTHLEDEEFMILILAADHDS